MAQNRFAQLKETYNAAPPKTRVQAKGKQEQVAQRSPESYNKKQRYPFSLHYDVRYHKLEDLVAFHGAKSASAYLEDLIVKEWNKMQRKSKD